MRGINYVLRHRVSTITQVLFRRVKRESEHVYSSNLSKGQLTPRKETMSSTSLLPPTSEGCSEVMFLIFCVCSLSHGLPLAYPMMQWAELQHPVPSDGFMGQVRVRGWRTLFIVLTLIMLFSSASGHCSVKSTLCASCICNIDTIKYTQGIR